MDAALTLVRWAHFAAVIVLFGQFAYAYGVDPDGRLPLRFRATVAWSLGIAIVSAVAWLLLEASHMSGLPMRVAWETGAVRTVLEETHFGNVCAARLAVAVVVGLACFAAGSPDRPVPRAIGAVGALAILASLAACGHAAAGSGTQGAIRLGADALHLAAAGAWLGSLVPFAAMLAHCTGDKPCLDFAHRAARRFSTLGTASVAIIVFTGIVNARYTVRTLDALVDSRYGIELLVKVAIFLVILALAAANRWRHTPRLSTTLAGPPALRALRRNVFLEIVLGVSIVAIVANLGITMPPHHG